MGSSDAEFHAGFKNHFWDFGASGRRREHFKIAKFAIFYYNNPSNRALAALTSLTKKNSWRLLTGLHWSPGIFVSQATAVSAQSLGLLE